jgi:hypothetical protein
MTMTSSKSALFYLGACFALWASSCSLAFNLDENQCEKDDDCKARGFMNGVCQSNVCVVGGDTTSSGVTTTTGTGGNLPAGWECLGHFKYPDTTGMTVQQDFQFLDALTQQPTMAVKAKLCGPLDGNCTTPTMSNLKPDSMGNLTIDIPQMPGFYLDLVDDSMGTGGAGGTGPLYRNSLAYLGSPIVVPPGLKTIRLITNAGLQQLAAILSANEDPTHGVAVVLTPNCNDVRSAGVIVTTTDVDAETQIYYFKNSLPNKTATETDGEGAVGIFNLPAGTAGAPRSSTFTTRLATPECISNPTSCQQIGTATVFIRPGTLTYVHVGPSP